MSDDRAYARRSDPETSHEAAESVTPIVTDLEAKVFSVIKCSPGGLTLDEIVSRTGLDKVTASPRLRPLCKKGLVTENGKRRGSAGRSQTVWMARESCW